MKNTAISILKILALGLIFFLGTIIGGIAAEAAGLTVPDMPDGTDPTVLAGYLVLASLCIGALMAYLAVRIDGNFLARWLALSAFGWVVYSVSTYIEAGIYTTFAAASLYKVVMDLAAFTACGAAAAYFFRANPAALPPNRLSRLSFRASGWAWRAAVTLAAFPIIYLSVGKLVEPLVIDIYRQGLFELTAPGWGQIIAAQIVRSLLFLAVCLGVRKLWNRSRVELWLGLAAAFFLLVGGLYMLQAYWFPGWFRLVHSLEMLADAILYTGCLTLSFSMGRASSNARAIPLAATRQ